MCQVTSEELAAKRKANNPNGEPTGAYTGRCAYCHSNNLWDDMTMYGCNHCGAMYSNTNLKVHKKP